jgi:L-ascorbate metabolism protein UlaG (beta-lactamase superfamily)
VASRRALAVAPGHTHPDWPSAPTVSEVTFVGHSTVLIETAGKRLLTDPLLRLRVAHLRRLGRLPEIEGLREPDVVLVSHAHLDHLDLPSLRLLTSSPRVIGAPGTGRLLRRAGIDAVTEVAVGARVAVGGLEVTATPAHHDGRRLPLARAADAVGFLIEGARRIYFAGDTDIFDGMRDLAPGLDLALLPVAGWGSRLPRGHLDPYRAAQAAALLRPRLAVPIHWGTLAEPWRRSHDIERPAREFARLAASSSPDVEVAILRPGDRLSLT